MSQTHLCFYRNITRDMRHATPTQANTMSLAQHLKREQLLWRSRKHKNYMVAGDSSTSIIANMEQDMGCPSEIDVNNVKKSQFIDNEELAGKTRPAIVDKGTTSGVGVQCSGMMSDALQENTRRIRTKMERIRHTMIDYYSTLIWHEHRGHPKLAMVYIDAYIILMDQLFLCNMASSLDGVVNIRQETREEFQRNILPYQELSSYSATHLPAECILAYQEIIYNLLAARGITNLPSTSIRSRDNPVTVLRFKMRHSRYHNKKTMQNDNVNAITVSVFMIVILVCGIYYVILNV